LNIDGSRVQKLIQKASTPKGTQADSGKKPNRIAIISDEIVQEVNGQRSVSIASNRAYLNALLETRRFDDYLSNAIDVIMVD
jgi:hypothetical protein